MVPLVTNKRVRRATVMAVIITRRKMRNASKVEKVRFAISPKTKQRWNKKHKRKRNHRLVGTCFKLPQTT